MSILLHFFFFFTDKLFPKWELCSATTALLRTQPTFSQTQWHSVLWLLQKVCLVFGRLQNEPCSIWSMNCFQNLIKKYSVFCVWVPEVCVEVSELPLIELHSLNHQAHHLLTVPWTPLVWAEEEKGKPEKSKRRFIFTWKHCNKCSLRSEQMHAIQTSGFLSEFAEQLQGLSFTEEQRGEESKVRHHKAVVFLLFLLFLQLSLVQTYSVSRVSPLLHGCLCTSTMSGCSCIISSSSSLTLAWTPTHGF